MIDWTCCGRRPPSNLLLCIIFLMNLHIVKNDARRLFVQLMVDVLNSGLYVGLLKCRNVAASSPICILDCCGGVHFQQFNDIRCCRTSCCLWWLSCVKSIAHQCVSRSPSLSLSTFLVDRFAADDCRTGVGFGHAVRHSRLLLMLRVAMIMRVVALKHTFTHSPPLVVGILLHFVLCFGVLFAGDRELKKR